MKMLILTGLAVALALPLRAAGQRGAAAGCDPLGDVRFICNQVAPEDLALVPGGAWLISSGMAANGAIRLINLRDKTTTAIFPTATPKERWDKKTYAACPGPIDPAEQATFRAHGLYLRDGGNRPHTLFVVHHGNRESIEVFELDARAKPPALTWIGRRWQGQPGGSLRWLIVVIAMFAVVFSLGMIRRHIPATSALARAGS